MATFKKPHNLRGTLNGITYYEYRGKSCARSKSNLDNARIKSDPAFLPMRLAGTRFGRASSIAKVFRNCIAPFGRHFSDGMLHNRLVSAIITLAKTTPELLEGEKFDFTALQALLGQFEFSATNTFANTVRVEQDCYHLKDRDEIRLEVALPYGKAFRNAPTSTHLRVLFILAPLNPLMKAPSFNSGVDIASKATWASDWFPANEWFCVCPIIPIPPFLRQGHPIAMLIAIEPGTAMDGQTPVPTLTGRAMRVMGLLT